MCIWACQYCFKTDFIRKLEKLVVCCVVSWFLSRDRVCTLALSSQSLLLRVAKLICWQRSSGVVVAVLPLICIRPLQLILATGWIFQVTSQMEHGALMFCTLSTHLSFQNVRHKPCHSHPYLPAHSVLICFETRVVFVSFSFIIFCLHDTVCTPSLSAAAATCHMITCAIW